MESAPPEPLSFPPHMWRISRMSARLILDISEVSRAGGHMMDPLLLSTITEANVTPINQDPELQRRYAGLDAPPPDELRRPISIAALARSLGLPFETVRRRVRHLAATGACVIGPRGVIVPTSFHAAPANAEMAVRRYELARAFHLDLLAAGVLGDLPEPDGPPMTDVPVRAVNRLLSEYFHRVAEGLMAGLGDPVSGIVLLGLVRETTDHLPPEVLATEGPLPDHLRRPVRKAALAARLGMPAETLRRYLGDLEKKGFCRPVEGGMISAATSRGPFGVQVLIDNALNVQRLAAKLARAGVLAWWEAEADAGDQAAAASAA